MRLVRRSRAAFAAALQVADGEPVQPHIAQTRALMQRLGVHGFPGWLQGQLGPLQPHGMPGPGRAGTGGLA